MFVLYDLGAEGGIAESWKSKKFKRLFEKIEVVAFDLDDKNILVSSNDVTLKLIDKIVCDENHVADFYIPKRDSGSSLFKFNKAYSYLHDEDYHPLKKTIKVETTTLKSLIDSNKIKPADIIKMDIQGAELYALRGLGDYIETAHVIELEVEFLPIYDGQPTFVEIHKFMTDAGFHLQDLHLSKSYLTDGKTPDYYLKVAGQRGGNPNWTPQVYAGDALYVRDMTTVLDSSIEFQMRHLKCLCAYNCFDRAFLITDRSRYKTQIQNDKLYSILVELAAEGRYIAMLMNFFARISRKLGLDISPFFDRKYSWIKRNFPNL